MIALLVFPVSCKEPEKASKKNPASDNANPGPVTPQSERPEKKDKDDDKDDDDDCKNKTDKDEDEDEDEDDDDDKIGLRLTGKSVASGNSGDIQKKKSGKKKSSKHNSKKKSKKNLADKSVSAPVRGFGLIASDPNYDDDIKSIFSDKCVSCHASEDDYPLDTYEKSKSLKTKIGEQVESGDMPPKNKTKLTSSEKSTIQKWVDSGALESATTDENDEDDDDKDDDDDKKKDDCDDDEDDDKKDKIGTAADWDELLKLKEVAKCKEKDFIFDRLKETCHKAKIASFECSKTGVLKAFKDLSIDVETQYDDFVGDGFKIDQCGEYNKEPVVLFYKKKEENNELKLLIKKLCKKGSDACDN